MDYHNLDDIIRDDIKQNVKEQIYKCMKVYGIEGLEDKLKELYNKMPKVLELFLSEYYKIVRGK
jgi:hypothetical protein